MNIFKILNDFVKELCALKQFKRMSKGMAIVLLILLFPFYVNAFAMIGGLYVLAAFFELIFLPIDYLSNFMHQEAKEVKHATEAIIYLICLPFIFLRECIKATMYAVFGAYFFMLSVYCQIISLQGMTFSPFIFKQKERDLANDTFLENRHSLVILLVVIVSYILCVLGILLAIPGLGLSKDFIKAFDYGFYEIVKIIIIVQQLINMVIFVVYPIFNFSKDKHTLDALHKILAFLGVAIACVVLTLSIVAGIISSPKASTSTTSSTITLVNTIDQGFSVEAGKPFTLVIKPDNPDNYHIIIRAANNISGSIISGDLTKTYNGVYNVETMYIGKGTKIIINSDVSQIVNISIY